MKQADQDAQRINVIAAMTADEVRDGLRQFGLRPIKRLTPELGRRNSIEQWRSDEPGRVERFVYDAGWVPTFRLPQLLNTIRGTSFLRWLATATALALCVVASIMFGTRAHLFDEPTYRNHFACQKTARKARASRALWSHSRRCDWDVNQY